MVWPVFVATGLEVVRIDPGNTAMTPLDFVSYPYSHSLLFLTLWGLMLAWVYRLVTGHAGIFQLLALLVMSHWVLDVATHRPDMPLYPGGPRFGLSLWNSIPATVAIETALFAAGVWIYTRVTRPKDAIGRWGLVGIVLLLGAGYVGAANGAPPPSVTALWVVSLAGAGLGTVLSWWVGSHRGSSRQRHKAKGISEKTLSLANLFLRKRWQASDRSTLMPSALCLLPFLYCTCPLITR